MKSAFWCVAVAGILSACSAPTFDELGEFKCAKNHECPETFVCELGTNICRKGDGAAGDSGDVLDASTGDAGQDATVSDANDAAQDAVPDGPVVDASDGAVVLQDAAPDSPVVDANDGAVKDAGDAGVVSPIISVSPLTGTTSESGTTFAIMVSLGGLGSPAAEVTIDVSSSNTAEGTVSPAKLTFTQANWSTPQTVTVTGVADGVWDENTTYTVIFAPSASSDPSWKNVVGAPVSVTNTDVDLPVITRMSLSTSGAEGNEQSGGLSTTFGNLGGPTVVSNGDVVVFATAATNFTTTDTNGGPDVLLRLVGPSLTMAISANDQNGSEVAWSGASRQPVASSDSNFVMFYTLASNAQPQVAAGCIIRGASFSNKNTTYQLSTSTSCVPYDMSSDGAYGLFTEPVSGVTTLKRFDKSASTPPTATSTAITALGTPTFAAISGDGRYVTFLSTNAFDVAADTNGANDLYLVDMTSPSTFTLVSKASNGSALGASAGGISPDGAYVWFVTQGAGDPADTDGAADVYIASRTTLGSNTLASRMATSGAVGLADISNSGQYLAFEFTPSGGDGHKEVWVYERGKQTNKSLHKTSAGGVPDGTIELPSISADGKYIAYVGWATNLVSGDTNGKADIFRVVRP